MENVHTKESTEYQKMDKLANVQACNWYAFGQNIHPQVVRVRGYDP